MQKEGAGSPSEGFRKHACLSKTRKAGLCVHLRGAGWKGEECGWRTQQECRQEVWDLAPVGPGGRVQGARLWHSVCQLAGWGS